MGVKHVSIILDGNRRWAKENGLSSFKGHQKGAENLEEIAKGVEKLGVEYLTVYIFSTENWKRSKSEVSYLMKLFKSYFKKLTKNLESYNFKIKFWGTRHDLTKDLLNIIEESEKKTADATGPQLNLCFNYGGRRELTEATQKIAELVKAGEIQPNEITEELISDNLNSKGVPDPDVLIRTSGEQRLSNYLPWQLSYTELFFVDKHWPDFTIDDLKEVLEDFKKRDRRYGGK